MKTVLSSLSALAVTAVLGVTAAPALASGYGHEPATTATTQGVRPDPYSIPTLPNGLPAGIVRDASPSAQESGSDATTPGAPPSVPTLPNGLPAGIVRDASPSQTETPVVKVVEPGGFHWTEALLGAAVGAGVIVAVALGALYSTRHHHGGPVHA